jgi:peptide/nickel transport system substrate-binding protein
MHDSARTPSASRGQLLSRIRGLRTVLAVAFAVALAASTAACGTAEAVNDPAPKKGGTLRVILGGQPNHLDPQQVYVNTEANLSRLFTRTLTTFKSAPGQAASEIVGDLATDTGRPGPGNRTWDFTLKKSVRWEDGSPATCAQVKYGIERSFSQLFTDGAPYPRTYLDATEGYQGPFVGGNNGGKGLPSIECIDTENIRFHLKQAVGDFGYTVSLPTFAPVPPEHDTKEEYDKRPFTNGAYRIEESTAQQLVLVRNKFWDPATDQVRKAYPDRIVVTWNPDTASVTNQLIESAGDWADTISIEKDVAAPFVQQVINDTQLSERTVRGPTGAIRYFAINTRTIPSELCRQALVYAFNKRKYRSALGGAAFGDFATTMIGPSLKAHKDFDLYNSRTNVEGDVGRANALIKQAADAKQPCPTKIKVAYPDTKDAIRVITTIIEAYQRIGIEVVRAPHPQKGYFASYIGNPDSGLDLMYAGWIPDWANGSSVIPPLFDGRGLVVAAKNKSGSTNFSNLDSKEINNLVDAALAEPSLERQYVLWGQLDEKIQSMAVTIPVLYPKVLKMAGTNVRGGFIHPQFGQPDLSALGLADPTT